MNLVINTSALDLTAAAVTSASDLTALTDLEQLVMGDDEPISVTFTTSAGAAPAWATDATYVMTVAIGGQTPAGLLELAYSSTFTLAAGVRSGTLALTTDTLLNFARLHLSSYPGRRSSLGLTLHIRITTPTGKNITYALLPVIVSCPVIIAPSGIPIAYAARFITETQFQAQGVQNYSFTGIASTESTNAYLCGLTTVGVPAGMRLLAGFGSNIQVLFELVATTATSAGFIFAPYDYDAATPLKWRVRAVWNLGVPSLYNADTTLWHNIGATGAADAVSLWVDQTGFALPT